MRRARGATPPVVNRSSERRYVVRVPLGLLLGSVLMAGTACATGPAAPPSVNVTGQWGGTWAYENAGIGTGDIRGTFQQDGANVSGDFTITGSNIQHRVSDGTG